MRPLLARLFGTLPVFASALNLGAGLATGNPLMLLLGIALALESVIWWRVVVPAADSAARAGRGTMYTSAEENEKEV